MNHQSLFVALVFLIQADFSALAQNVCINEAGNYTANSAYSRNLNTTIASLSRNVNDSRNVFYNASVGQGIDTANALVLCKGDAQLDACRDCVETAAAELRQSCPNQKQAIHWDGTCMLRYSNASMYRVVATSPAYYLFNLQNASDAEQFKEDLRALVDPLINQAASGGPLRKVGAASVPGPAFQTIFAYVECTPDLSQDECNSCLLGARSEIPQCCDGKRGGVIVKPSCSLRFETYPFVNETRLQELESAPAPPPLPLVDPPPVKDDDRSNTSLTIIIIVIPVIVCLVLAAFGIIWLRKREKRKPTEKHGIGEVVEEISTDESLQYPFSTIKAATNDFSDNNKLGQGGFGTVYKGKLPNGREIAVKRLSRDSGQGNLEFKNEVLLLAKLQHRNLVRLLGFSMEGMEKLLVYEFVENASLDLFIFDRTNRSYLDWDKRLKIVVGIARGILYLHEDSRLRIIHRDLKASNILLDMDMNPKIADFGMARLFGQDETQANTSRIVGTYGYMPPEYLLHGQFSIKSDVFSFGVLVLEIISGRKNISFRNGESVEDLLSFAWKNWRDGTARNVVDPLLRRSSGSMSDMVRCIHIGLLCVQENVDDRPTMASVIIMLSSFTMSLPVPCEPAFYSSSASASRIHHHDSSTKAEQSDHSSREDDASISEIYPR